jgi:hypothetical protein
MTTLGDQFAAQVHRQPVTITRGDRNFLIRPSHAQAETVKAYMEIVENDEVIGYFTEYGNNESGVVPARLFGYGLPKIFGTVEDALDDLAH